MAMIAPLAGRKPATTVPVRAWEGIVATRARPLLDPVDPVAAAYAPLAGHPCLALRAPFGPAISCGESVLRLALTLIENSKIGGADDPPYVPLLTQVPAAGLSLPEMVRRLMHLGIRDFPVYLFVDTPGLGMPKFNLVSGKDREDHWCMLFLPQSFPGMPVAHWTFTKIAPVEPDAVVEVPDMDMMVYTSSPLEYHPHIYWRCRPTPENLEQFWIFKSHGQACRCCFLIPCWHEIWYRLKHTFCRIPFRRVSLISKHFLPGTHRVMICGKASGYSAWNVSATPDRGTAIETPQGYRHIAKESRQNAAVVNLGYYLSFLPAGILTATDELYYRTLRGFARFRAAWGCWFKFIEQPVEVVDAVIPPMRVKLCRYRDGVSLWREFRGCLWNLTWAYSGYWAINTILSTPIELLNRTFSLMKYSFFRRTIGILVKNRADLALVLMYNGIKKLVNIKHFLGLFTFRIIRSRFLHYVMSVPPAMAFAETRDLDLRLPRLQEVVSRLSVRETVTRADAVDIVRRICNEEHWPHPVNRDEFATWLERVVTEPGKATVIPPVQAGQCVTCFQIVRTYRQECKSCKRRRRTRPPGLMKNVDTLVTYIGRRGIWSMKVKPIEFTLKPDVVMRVGRKKLRNRKEFVEWFNKQDIQETCRGMNAGPAFLGWQPMVYPKGVAIAALAFCVRLGVARLYEPHTWVWDMLFDYVVDDLEPLEPESRDYFLSHFSGPKREIMLEAEKEINEGWMILPNDRMATKGFTKAENCFAVTYQGDGHLQRKPKMKPRFICCPDTKFMFLVGPYTHRQTKWMAETYGPKDREFYAGCADPETLNLFLADVLSEIPDGIVYADDIEAADSNHNAESFRYHERVRNIQFRAMPPQVALAFRIEQRLKIVVKEFRAEVDDVNASGVPDTSYKNSMIYLKYRTLAIAHAVSPLGKDWKLQVSRVRAIVRSAAAGDDGWARMPRVVLGTDMCSPEAIERYEQFWALSGFKTKLAIYPEHRWRMATFLACRPVWDGTRYVWTPEPARRIKKLFWQLDNTMHPTAWARGIASQLLGMARPHPFLAPTMEWFLANTRGPAVKDVEVFDNPYNPMRGASYTGKVNVRAIEEFLLDYNIPASAYEEYLDMLNSTKAVHVEFRGRLLERLFAEES